MESVTIQDLERLYPRMEELDATDTDTISRRLREDTTGKVVRTETSGIRKLSETLAMPFDVKNRIERAENFTELESEKERIDEIEIGRANRDLRNIANERENEIANLEISRINQLTDLDDLEKVRPRPVGISDTIEDRIAMVESDRRDEIEQNIIDSVESSRNIDELVSFVAQFDGEDRKVARKAGERHLGTLKSMGLVEEDIELPSRI